MLHMLSLLLMEFTTRTQFGKAYMIIVGIGATYIDLVVVIVTSISLGR